MNIAAIIVGIDGWEQYTLPLIESIQRHEPKCAMWVIDNASKTPYPMLSSIFRTDKRMNYSTAINRGHRLFEPMSSVIGWYIVLSNDVLCTGPFADILDRYSGVDLVGPDLKQTHGFDYLEGWCVCIPAAAWQPWDERFLGSDWEDVDFCTAARQRGYGLVGDESFPFVHLDQRQRYRIVEDFWGKDAHNRELFMSKYAAAVTV